jgi:hypothetical protein
MLDLRLVADIGLVGGRADVVGARDLGRDRLRVFGGVVDQCDLFD